MNTHRPSIDTELDHQTCESLLPAYIHGHLEKQMSQAVARHIADCSQCQHALQMANHLRMQLANDTDALHSHLQLDHIDANFERLWAQLETHTENPTPPTHEPPPPLRRKYARPGVALLGVGLLLLSGALLTHSTRQSHYQTLADAPVAASDARLRVLFDDNIPLATLQQILLQSKSEIVAGPTHRGVFTLRTADSTRALALLRQHPHVLVAETASY